jgi:diguanylate cyclase (GGDEF)-like protein
MGDLVRRSARKCSLLRALPAHHEQAMSAQLNADLDELLPVVAPLFGAAVLLFSAWDLALDSANAWLTLLVRIAFVAVGALAYASHGWRWNAIERCGLIYCTHTSAIVLAAFLLRDGLLYGLAGIVACQFLVSVVTLRIRDFALMQAPPGLLLWSLVASTTTTHQFLKLFMPYLFALVLAAVVMLVIRFSRRKAYLVEQELLDRSRRDSLTGACNRAYLEELAERELALARRHGRPLAVAMIDIDYFKLVNDTHGHAVGDEVIRRLCSCCIEHLREVDHFGRIGGEEFACILPETDADAALQCAERLRQALAALTVTTPQGPLQFTVSIGLALFDADHADWAQMLAAADGALYQAKHAGRNRVVLASSGLPVGSPHA